ncbi:MAG TPA: hypothetical protein VMV99_06305 [Rhodanobacter sp.]|nr:hypothetical protein [Rhodanobacter sp.]
MSDFLDRLVGRAIGSEPLLAPRLPSLFEPLQRAPIMPLSDDGETSALQREAVPASTAALAVAPLRSPHAPAIALTDTSHAAPAAVAPMAALTPVQVAASTSRTVVPPAPIAAPAPSSVVERSVESPAPPHPAEAFVPLQPVQPRQTRIAAKQQEAPAPPHSSNGALLPVSSPVFGAARTADAPSRSIHAAAIRTLAAQAGAGSPSGEPVVRVSIGRLEVRAAPAAAPPRRRDGPRPGSLDDYLRQRGKVSP